MKIKPEILACLIKMAKDILVKTNNPDGLDKIVNGYGAALVGGGMPNEYKIVDGCYVVRCFGDSGFIKFMISNQGYGEFVRELEELI